MIYREYHMPFGKYCPTLRKINGAGEQCFGLLEMALFCRRGFTKMVITPSS